MTGAHEFLYGPREGGGQEPRLECDVVILLVVHAEGNHLIDLPILNRLRLTRLH